MEEDSLILAASLHRRWRGVAPVLFVVFYSLFFAAHLKLDRSAVYMKDGVVMGSGTTSFFTDLVVPQEQAGSGGTGAGNAFLLLHHPPARLLAMAWQPFSETENAARRHAVAMLTAGAGAMLVVFFYLALLWAGVARLRVVILSLLAGCSVGVALFAVLPLPFIFAGMGVAAALAAVARGPAGHMVEFPLAALYLVCCSFWNIIPVFMLALLRAIRACRGGADYRPVVHALVSVVLLGAAGLGAMKLQHSWYPRTAVAEPLQVLSGAWADLGQAAGRTFQVNWAAKLEDVVLADVVAPAPATADENDEMQKRTTRAYALPSADWGKLTPDLRHAAEYGWLLLVAAALLAMPFLLRRSIATVAALLLVVWFVWLDGVTAPTGPRLLHASLWTATVVFLVGLGLELYAHRWPKLRWPLTGLQVAVLGLVALRNQQFMREIAETVAL